MLKHTQAEAETQANSVRLQAHLLSFLGGFWGRLNRRMDRRLVCTFLGILMAILCHRHRQHGLLLSELGAYLLGPERGQAGTMRLSNLLHSMKWQAQLIAQFLWRQGHQGPPTLAHLGWWTTRGEHQTSKRPLEQGCCAR